MRAADLTVDELRALIQEAVREILDEARPPTKQQTHSQWGILEILPLEVDPHHPALSVISREDMYGEVCYLNN